MTDASHWRRRKLAPPSPLFAAFPRWRTSCPANTTHTCTRCSNEKETRPLAQSSSVEGFFQRCGREAAQRLSVHWRSVSHGHRFRSGGCVSAGVRNRGERTLEEHTSLASSKKHNSLRWRGGRPFYSRVRCAPPPSPNKYVSRACAWRSSVDGAANGNKGKQAHTQDVQVTHLHHHSSGKAQKKHDRGIQPRAIVEPQPTLPSRRGRREVVLDRSTPTHSAQTPSHSLHALPP